MGGSHPTSRIMVELMFKLLKTKLMNVLCDRIDYAIVLKFVSSA